MQSYLYTILALIFVLTLCTYANREIVLRKYEFAGTAGGGGMMLAITTTLVIVVIVKRRRASKRSGEC